MGWRRPARAVTVLALIVGSAAGCDAGTGGATAPPSRSHDAQASPPAAPSAVSAGTSAPVPAPGSFVAVPTDGSPPDRALDVGGPGLKQMCVDNAMPIPADLITVGCAAGVAGETVPTQGFSSSANVQLDPGTYWIVLACDAPGTFALETTVPGLTPRTTLKCADDGSAVRRRLGTVDAAASGDVTSLVFTSGTTYLHWIVREGKTSL